MAVPSPAVAVTRRYLTLGATAALSVCAIWYGHLRVPTASVPSSPQPMQAARVPNAASASKAIQTGDSVTVNYTGKLADGQVFDSTAQSGPLTFTVGSGDVIPGVENAVLGLHAGDSVTVQVDPAQGYGERRSDLVVTVPASRAPAGLQVGQQVSLGGRPAVVTQVNAAGVTVDANPPLAGKVLTFQISVLSIGPASAPGNPPPQRPTGGRGRERSNDD
jgi:peptidylprolyl isomerase